MYTSSVKIVPCGSCCFSWSAVSLWALCPQRIKSSVGLSVHLTLDVLEVVTMVRKMKQKMAECGGELLKFFFSDCLIEGIEKVQECNNGSESSIGLWLDMIVFTFITIQIIILDTKYADHVRDNVIRKEEDAQKYV